MSALYTGTSGLQTSQNALNTTGHNLTNIDTVGYTRQQVEQADKSYITIQRNTSIISNKQYGLGVEYADVKQVRDYFLDKSYRQESGRLAFYEVSRDVMLEIESQLGEMQGKAFQEAVTDLWTSVEEMSKDPCSSVTQALFAQKASEFIERAGAVYEGFSDYQDNLNAQIKQQIEKINKYGNRILELNEKIGAIEAGGIERANDLRDERNYILDQLGDLAKISFSEDQWHHVSVQIEGVDFVKGSMCYEIALDQDKETGFYTPFWPMNASYTINNDGNKVYDTDGAEVFNLKIEISTDHNTDIGRIKGMLLARGDHRADYTDDLNNYSAIEQSVVMNVQAEFDLLIHSVSTKINEVIGAAAGVKTNTDGLTFTLEDGTELKGENIKYAKVDTTDTGGYLRDNSGRPMQIFVKSVTDGYVKATGSDNEEYWVYVDEIPDRKDSLYSVRNIQINQELMQSPGELGFRLIDGSEDNDTMAKLKEAYRSEEYFLNPRVRKASNFESFYNDLVAQIGNSGYVYKGIYDNQENTVESITSAREQIVGVSSDEELSNMIKFQNAYNASSRYINVISEMLEHIITTLGR